jgi:amidase
LVRIWNVTGQPAISLPLRLTEDGVPVGIQMIAAPGCDHVLISVAAQIEAAHGWNTAP